MVTCPFPTTQALKKVRTYFMAENSDDPKPLDKIKSSGFSRGLSLLKASIKAGSFAAKQLRQSSKNPEEQLAFILRQVKGFTDEIGQLKGSAMKVGQLLSTYGEHFLPPEANKILKSLQQKSPPVSWSVVEKQLKSELGEKMNLLEIDCKPIASASIGQVHRATIKDTGQKVALKVQYPGVDQAIDSDMKLFKLMLGSLNLLPRGANMGQIFEEVRSMLVQEMDYRQELAFTNFFYEQLQEDSRYLVPKTFPEFCTQRIMVTEFMEGVAVDSPEVEALSLERRNRLGENYLDLYLRELLQFQKVQTDPHFGNYRVKIDSEGQQDQLVLFDFGAIREVPPEFLKNYRSLIEGGLEQNSEQIIKTGKNLKLIFDEDSPELTRRFEELCLLITEPFSNPEDHRVPSNLMDSEGRYDWGGSDLPKRVAKKGGEIALNFKLRSPPKETVFLDRKLGGVFIFLKVLQCKMETRTLLIERLKTFSL
tara:strand:- start:60 stop:1496 length:1437 start_codon:yes stop_codon:yes gene_type:complete